MNLITLLVKTCWYAPNIDMARRLAAYGNAYRLLRMVGVVAWFLSHDDHVRALRALERVRSLLSVITT